MTTHAPRFRTALGTAVLAITVLASCGEGSAPTTKQASPVSDTRTSAAPAPSQDEVSKRLAELEKAHGARIGAYAVDTGTGRFLSYRGEERFPFASTGKAMTCGAVLKKARTSDPGLMDRVIRYGKGDLVEHSPVTEKHVGTGMTVAELCEAAITVSDNTAENLVLEQTGGPKGLTAFLRSVGDPVSRSDRTEPSLNDWRPGELRDTTTPRPWAQDLRALSLGGALAPADSERLNGWLKASTTGDARIRAGLPKSWTVGDKTGSAGVYGNTNDIAVAWPPAGGPVVITVLLTKPDAAAEPDEKAVAETARILSSGLRGS